MPGWPDGCHHRRISLLAGGAIRSDFREQGGPEFIGSAFGEQGDTLDFAHGVLTDSARAKLQLELRALRSRFA